MSKSVLKSQLKGENLASSTPIWRKIFFICVWLFWLGLLGLLLLAAYCWAQRYDILEEQTRRLLAENNIQADLDVVSITRDKLRIDSIALSDQLDAQAPPFFAADRIEAEYVWQDLLRGQIKSLSFTRPQAMIEIDASGKIIGGWVPPSQSGTDGDFMLPEQGVNIKEGHLTLLTPYGTLVSAVDASVKDSQTFDVALNIEPSSLSFKGQSGTVSGLATVLTKGGVYAAKTDLNFADISMADLLAKAGQLRADIDIKKQEAGWQVDGPLSLDIQALTGDGLNIGAVSASSEDIALNQTSEQLFVGGPIILDMTDVSSPAVAAQNLKLTSNGDFILDAKDLSLIHI